MPQFDSSTLTEKTTFWAIWTQARKIRRNRFNKVTSYLTALTLFAYAISSKQSPHEMAEMIRNWANAGLSFAGTILGFLIAGFTIFATLSKPSLLAAMARIPEDESRLSYLKYNFFAFFETFGWYVGFSGICVLVLVFGSAGGAVTQLASLAGAHKHQLAEVIPRVGMVVVGTWFVILCLELKSFLYNIYHAVMTSIRWSIDYPEDGDLRIDPPEDPQRSSAEQRASVLAVRSPELSDVV